MLGIDWLFRFEGLMLIGEAEDLLDRKLFCLHCKLDTSAVNWTVYSTGHNLLTAFGNPKWLSLSVSPNATYVPPTITSRLEVTTPPSEKSCCEKART